MFGRRKTDDARFPEVEGITLTGEALSLPSAFAAPWNLVVLTFRNEDDPLADQWIRLAERLAADRKLAAYECPLVEKGLNFARPLVSYGIQLQAEDEAERARTIPLFVDRDRFLKKLGVKKPDAVLVVLAAPDGRIGWRGADAMTFEQIADLEATLDRLTAEQAEGEQAPG